jgi:integrase
MTRHDNDGLRKLCGCSRRKWPKCDHPWHINFAFRGQPHRYSLDQLLSPKRIRAKTEAQAEAERIRSEIRNGTFRKPGATDDRPVLSTLTLAQLLKTYDGRYLSVERPAKSKSLENERYQIGAIGRVPLTLPTGTAKPFGEWFVADITTDALEQFRAARRTAGTIVTTNRNLALLRAAFNWAIRVGYVERTPFKRGTETVIKLSRELPRRRRLEPGEAERLLKACGAHLRAIVEAALETGCRKGELLSMQWHQVRAEPRQELVLPAQKTKTKRDRRIPISTRLAAILAMRRAGPDGVEHKPTAYVFGNEIGQRATTFKRAWERAVLVAHGHKAEYIMRPAKSEGQKSVKTAMLTPESRTQLRAINLHFHDLRREAGSRWLDGGVPLHTIRDWLGHANISQTSTYLESTFAGQHDAMRAFEERQAGLQKIASEVETGHQTEALNATHANTETHNVSAKHH